MSEEDKANKKEIEEKKKLEPDEISDKLKQPSTPGEVPVPYPETPGMDESSAGKVKISDKGVMGKGSVEAIEGDEVGTEDKTRDLGDLAEGAGSRVAEEIRKIIEYASNMGPEGYKLLIFTLMVGFLGGVLYQANICNNRISALSSQLDGVNGEMGLAPTNVFNPPNWDMELVVFDLEMETIMVQILNRGPGALFFQSISVTRLPGDTTIISTNEEDMMPLHLPGVGHINWTAEHAGAPDTFLDDESVYRIKVTLGNGFWAIWQGKAR